MALGLARADLRAMAQAKIDDAALLFQHGRFANAYYLAGYAVEFGLKACIAKVMATDTIPDLEFVRAIYVHDVEKLVKVAGLTRELDSQQRTDASFAANWTIVAEWNQNKRYEITDRYTAHLMVSAVSEPHSGVLQWIRTYW